MWNIPKWKPNELIKALLQITMDTDETTDRVNAPTVPSWNRSPSPIFFFFFGSFLVCFLQSEKPTTIPSDYPLTSPQKHVQQDAAKLTISGRWEESFKPLDLMLMEGKRVMKRRKAFDKHSLGSRSDSRLSDKWKPWAYCLGRRIEGTKHTQKLFSPRTSDLTNKSILCWEVSDWQIIGKY